MRTVLALLCLAVYCAAQQPTPCKSPEQWEGRIYRSDRSKEFAEIGKVSYDETNMRVRIIEEREIGSEKDYYDTLYLHNIRREYKFNLKTKQCNVTTLMRPFRPFGVPPFAKFLFEAEIGAAGVPGESLIAQTWDGEFEDKSRFVSTVTYPDCVPLSSGFYSNETGFVQSDFFDISLGISDPMVFIPPQECNTR
ncbi:mammalian ependymin-related protein 1-like [Mercenaria mercenaria]|uniref:mammalian ependymin-related protein 1-like n=1 Tax=Mercenaria mercenaria TaxID=6596 RepID=UPI001E1DFE09|nr:mammalian ependymin-related protein 1-like [Mercenaria mercenaria]